MFKGTGCVQESNVKLEVDPNVKPVHDPPRKIPIRTRGPLKKHLKDLSDMNIIRKVNGYTPWTNSIVIAHRKDKSIRLCLDPRNLNKAIKRPVHCLPDTNFIRSELKGSKFFTELDVKNGF